MNRITNPEHPDTDYLDWREGSGNTIEIFDIVVGSERGRGIGRRMVEELLTTVRADHVSKTLIFAITRQDNHIAREFYTAIGFREMGRLVNFYSPESRMIVDAIMYGYDVYGPRVE
jgi:ribosomal protein S18 acetylase RimI-like enzyme